MPHEVTFQPGDRVRLNRATRQGLVPGNGLRRQVWTVVRVLSDGWVEVDDSETRLWPAAQLARVRGTYRDPRRRAR